MPNYGQYRLPEQSLAENFELPENRYLGGGGAAAPQPQSGAYQPTLPLGAPAQNLADVEGLTGAYYDTWGKLQSLAQGMNKDYGLDVTKPDFTQPGGGQPFKSYQMLAGNLMTIANQLGNRLKEQQQAAPYKHTGQLTGSGEKDDPYISTHMVPELKAAQERSMDDFYTSGDARRAYEANVAPIEAELKAKAESGDPFWVRQYDIARRLKTTFQTHPTFFRNEYDEQNKKLKAAAGATREIGFARKLTAEAQGFWQPGSYEVKHEGDSTYAFKPAEANLRAGSFVNADNKTIPLIVDGWKRTQDGKTFLLYKAENPEDDSEVPENQRQVRVDNMTGDQLTTTLQQNNPRLGQTPTMYSAMDILGLRDQSGGLDTQALFGEDYKPLTETRGALDAHLKQTHEVELKKDKIRDRLSGLSSSPIAGMGGADSFDAPDGSKVVVRRHKLGSGFYIPDSGLPEHLTESQVLDYLQSKGIVGSAAQSGPTLGQAVEDKVKEVINPKGKALY